jgi:hypothetical protein
MLHPCRYCRHLPVMFQPMGWPAGCQPHHPLKTKSCQHGPVAGYLQAGCWHDLPCMRWSPMCVASEQVDSSNMFLLALTTSAWPTGGGPLCSSWCPMVSGCAVIYVVNRQCFKAHISDGVWTSWYMIKSCSWSRPQCLHPQHTLCCVTRAISCHKLIPAAGVWRKA